MPGKSAIRDPELKKIRALQMIQARLAGASEAEVAKMFSVHPETVKRILEWAKKQQLYQEAQQKVLGELVPLAHKALVELLHGDDAKIKAKIAIDIMKGAQVFQEKQLQGQIQAARQSLADEDDIYTIAAGIQSKLLEDGNTYEGEIVDDGSEGSEQTTDEETF